VESVESVALLVELTAFYAILKVIALSDSCKTGIFGDHGTFQEAQVVVQETRGSGNQTSLASRLVGLWAQRMVLGG
jgi:hypothetical protein